MLIGQFFVEQNADEPSRHKWCQLLKQEQSMAEKLTAAVTVKLSDTVMLKGTALAQLHGMCVSEFMRHLLDQALAAKEAEFRALESIFGPSAAKGEGNQE